MKANGKKLDTDTAAPFRLAKGVLSVTCDLYWELLEEFESACDKLLSSRRNTLVIDLTGVSFISSSFVGCLGNLIVKASRLGKKVMITVPRDVRWLFDIMGGQNNMIMEVL